jgi:hypothetical protein
MLVPTTESGLVSRSQRDQQSGGTVQRDHPKLLILNADSHSSPAGPAGPGSFKADCHWSHVPRALLERVFARKQINSRRAALPHNHALVRGGTTGTSGTQAFQSSSYAPVQGGGGMGPSGLRG